MLTSMDPYRPPDEFEAQLLRRELAHDLGIPESALVNILVARPTRFIAERSEAVYSEEPIPPSNTQYMVGKYLEVVITVDSDQFEIAEYEDLGGGMVPITLVRRQDGALTFTKTGAARSMRSPAELGEVVEATIRRLSNSRRHRYQRCRFCREMTPPELICQPGVCEPCAVTELGIVF